MRCSTPRVGSCCPGSTTTTSTCWHWLRRSGRFASVRPTCGGRRGSSGRCGRQMPRWSRDGGCGRSDTTSRCREPLDRHVLDAIVPGRPVRVQHRGGAMWVVNSAAASALGLAPAAADPGPVAGGEIGGAIPAGVELGADGLPTGRLFGVDSWLGPRVPREPLDLAHVGRTLLDLGVTGVTDATPTERGEDLELLAGAVAEGALPQEVMVTGGPGLDPAAGAALERGPVKLVVADHDLPRLDDLVTAIAGAHRAGRAVAVHCVTRVGLLLALAAWDETGARAGDRIEHGAVVHPAEAIRIAAHGLTVVTQPAFVSERGDDYLAEVDRRRPALPVALRRAPAGGHPRRGQHRRPVRSGRPLAGHRRRHEPPHPVRPCARRGRTPRPPPGPRPVPRPARRPRRPASPDRGGDPGRPVPARRPAEARPGGPVGGPGARHRPRRLPHDAGPPGGEGVLPRASGHQNLSG